MTGRSSGQNPKKWKIRRNRPMSQVLMDHIKLLWTASASAVQVQQEVRNQVDPLKENLMGAQGTLAAEALTYSPSKINKTENI